MINRTAEVVALIRHRIGPDSAYAAEADRHNCIHLCDSDGRVVAAARLEQTSWYACDVRNVVVREDAQGKGWGRKMLAKAEREASMRGFSVVMATVRESNFASRCLFYAAGYKQVGRFASRCTGRPLVLLLKSLV